MNSEIVKLTNEYREKHDNVQDVMALMEYGEDEMVRILKEANGRKIIVEEESGYDATNYRYE